jgi:hypothetical protein
MEQEISRVENLLNTEKEYLLRKENEKQRLQSEFEMKKREIQNSTDRVVTMPHSGPLVMGLLRQSVNLESTYTQKKLIVETEINNIKKNISVKEQQLQQLKQNSMTFNSWSSSFK